MLTVKVKKPDMEIPQSYITLTPSVHSHLESVGEELIEVVTFSDSSGVTLQESLPRGCQTEIYVENEKGRTVQAYKAKPPKAGSVG